MTSLTVLYQSIGTKDNPSVQMTDPCKPPNWYKSASVAAKKDVCTRDQHGPGNQACGWLSINHLPSRHSRVARHSVLIGLHILNGH